MDEEYENKMPEIQNYEMTMREVERWRKIQYLFFLVKLQGTQGNDLSWTTHHRDEIYCLLHIYTITRYHLYVESKKMVQMNLFKSETDSQT